MKEMHKKTTPRTYICEKLLSKKNGAQTRNRTRDTGIFSPLLYLLSYLGIHSILFFLLVGLQGLEPGTCRL